MPAPKDNLSDLRMFIAVAQEGSFTKAAARFGISQSAVSYNVRMLEDRLGLRLLSRTTRSLSPTEAGQRLLDRLGPKFEEIESELALLSELRNTPSGIVRINSVEHASQTILWPALQPVMAKYPDIQIEIIDDYRLTDIVATRFDAGVRLGEQLAQDMIALRIGPDFRQSFVGSPSYFRDIGTPKTPRDLTKHHSIELRLPTSGGLYPWSFAKAGQEITVRAKSRATFNTIPMMLAAAIDGIGIASLPEDVTKEAIKKGQLIRVLIDWSAVRPGYHLYYPSKKQPSAAFSVVLEALRSARRSSASTRTDGT